MTTISKRLLLFTGKLGYQTRCFEEAARKLGVQLIYITDRCHKLEDAWGDHAISVHFETPELAAHTVTDSLDNKNISGILAVGDQPTVAAAYVARSLGIPYNHPAAVEACRNKLRMREIFRDAGLLVPWFRSLPIHPTPEPALLGISYPCVLKPLSLSASQGVVRANCREEFLSAVLRIKRLFESPEILSSREANLGYVLIEGYIPGREVAVEGLLDDGVLRILAIFDKPDPLEGPYFEETLYVTPSRFPESQQRMIERCAAEAARGLGLSHGPIHAEFRINEEGIWPLEVAPRPIGGLCAGALRFLIDKQGDPIGLEELLLRYSLGLPGYHAPRERSASGVMMIPVPASGILDEIKGEDAARSIPGITDLVITARIQDYIAAWPEGSTYLGFIFARSKKPEDVEGALRAAHEKLSFSITPRLPVEHPATRRISP